VMQGDRHREAALRNNLADLLRETGRQDEAMDELKHAVVLFADHGEARVEPKIGDRSVVTGDGDVVRGVAVDDNISVNVPTLDWTSDFGCKALVTRVDRSRALDLVDRVHDFCRYRSSVEGNVSVLCAVENRGPNATDASFGHSRGGIGHGARDD